jgi:hypothetical protein
MADFMTERIELKDLPERTRKIAERFGATEFIRKTHAHDVTDLRPGERAAIQYVSTMDVDRDGEILLPKGCDLSEFRLAPQVFWGHDYTQLPIGSDNPPGWIKADHKGILAKTIYATTPFANDVFTVKTEGHLKTNSVGFVPLRRLMPGEAEYQKAYDELKEGGYDFRGKEVKAIISKWLLLEHSDVGVAANPHALQEAIAKGLKVGAELQKELGVEQIGEPWDYSLKPYPNEHSCRVSAPDKYIRFRRQNDKFGEGIHAIFGITSDETVELQAIRFDKSKFTTAEARKWCADHDHKCKPFEAATGEEASLCSIEVIRGKVEAEIISQPVKIEIPKKVEIQEIRKPIIELIPQPKPPAIVELVEAEINRRRGKV